MIWYPPVVEFGLLTLDRLPTGGRLARVKDGRMGLLRSMLAKVGRPATVTLSSITMSRAWAAQLRALADGGAVSFKLLLDPMFFGKKDRRADLLAHPAIAVFASKQHAKWTIVGGPNGRFVEHGSANFNGVRREENFWLDADPEGDFCAELLRAFDAATPVRGVMRVDVATTKRRFTRTVRADLGGLGAIDLGLDELGIEDGS